MTTIYYTYRSRNRAATPPSPPASPRALQELEHNHSSTVVCPSVKKERRLLRHKSNPTIPYHGKENTCSNELTRLPSRTYEKQAKSNTLLQKPIECEDEEPFLSGKTVGIKRFLSADVPKSRSLSAEEEVFPQEKLNGASNNTSDLDQRTLSSSQTTLVKKQMPGLLQQGSRSTLEAEEPRKRRRRGDGLMNLANTCYINSALQVLRNCQPLMSALQEMCAIATPPSEDVVEDCSMVLLKEFVKLSEELAVLSSDSMSSNGKISGPISPTAFVNAVRKSSSLFSNSRQQDVHEFISFLINHFADETGCARARQVFLGMATQYVDCLECKTTKQREEEFIDLSVPVREGNSLSWSLDQWTATEKLSGENKYYCDSCQTKTEANRYLRITKLPPVLCFHLQRFASPSDKLTSLMPTPEYLRLGRWCSHSVGTSSQDLYELFGVIVHVGQSVGHGHYIAYVKVGNEWREYDDAVVRVACPASLLMAPATPYVATRSGTRGGYEGRTPYMLFYRRC
ncbi:uncharacterized protein VTP21DRAFT_8748 [Calcarisporiella thermophila]|uniref:uncharacterized protein n=1 Tax=Calcarisporiella thermophila TaxID=911321 RepID=UPI003744AB87